MSTHYLPLKSICLEELFDGRLERFGIRERHDLLETTERNRCLTDGRNHVWVRVDRHESVEFVRETWNWTAVGRILDAIEEAFEVVVVSEYEPQYWGFETEEEWHAWEDERARANRERFYSELVEFVHGKPNDIIPGTVGEIQGKIAKQLVIDRPDLLLPEMKDEFLTVIEDAYMRGHAITVTLTEEELAFVDMLATHEDDLPSA